MTTKYHTITWDQLHRDARELSWRLLGQGPDQGAWRGIVAIARGGLIPAAIVARELDCRLIESLCVASYENEVRGAPILKKGAPAAGDGTGFLIIDDLADTGATLRLVRALLPNAHVACLYAKPDGRSMADTFITEVSQETWILFPWDTAPQFVPPVLQQRA